jgi:N-acyl-L-homoserine lactone synthetase
LDVTIKIATYKDMFDIKRLRYNVFSEEKNFEPSNALKMESDLFDDDAIHVIARDNATGKIVGTFRLIYNKPIPLSFMIDDDNLLSPVNFSTEASCEISRLTVAREYRGAVLAYALFVSIGCIGLAIGYSYAFALIEPSLARKLASVGIAGNQISSDIEHRGCRRAYIFSPVDFITHMLGRTHMVTLIEISELIQAKVLFNIDLVTVRASVYKHGKITLVV